MKPRQQRMLAVGLAVAGIAIAAALTFRAFGENMNLFVEVSDVVAGNYPHDRNFRIGGLVVTDSVERDDGSLEMRFRVTDMRCQMDVAYTGVVPDLFEEGQGVVAHGRMSPDKVFVADKILAKHDENYVSPEVAESLAKHVDEKMASIRDADSECTHP